MHFNDDGFELTSDEYSIDQLISGVVFSTPIMPLSNTSEQSSCTRCSMRKIEDSHEDRLVPAEKCSSYQTIETHKPVADRTSMTTPRRVSWESAQSCWCVG